MGPEPERAAAPMATLRRLLARLRGRRAAVALLLVPIAISVAAGLIGPRVTGMVIDLIGDSLKTEGPVPYGRLAWLMAQGFAAFLASQGCNLAIGFATNHLSNTAVRDLRAELFAHVQALPVGAFSRTPHGEFMSRLTNDVDMVANTLGQGITRFFETVLLLVATFAMMCYLSPVLTAVACCTLPLTFLLGRGIARASRRVYRERQRRLGEINGLVEETVTGLRTVQAFSHEAASERVFTGLAEDLRGIGIRAETLAGFMGPTMNLVGNLSFIVVAAAGGWLAAQDALSVGTIVAFLLYSRSFGRPVNELAQQFNEIQSAIAGAERVFRVLGESPEEDGGREAFDPAAARGEIEFRDVTFAYEPGKNVIEDFSVRIRPGEKIALVGETGSGKTTLVALLSRFFEIDSGAILLDGRDIRDLPKRALRSCMAVVLQDTHLFSGTIRENIAFGRPDATDEQIRAAARLANADLFIDRLPEGYATRINQAGTALSQGQCQLLAIARAALADPRILILDEATSCVDTRTELHIQQAMARLMSGRTCLVIAHRLSTIRDADRILVLDGGRLVESGTHDELVAVGGRYAALCAARAEAGAEDPPSP